eukprot:Plantae.Rhodophyta-Purpureofilum_apyrenoidigerum.ctg26510.p1 GENE.Plantae.Rhodophyta-Purpureofilum_apyrenoidigerum.ctg26510~~Plantae.Rhodophyta-Purpureofilum_apyrenoidigerum.ctg26510.p1  ORF type:complete len:218 (+),score=26.89 Plantae.Rhodophyta-Purpureofilum_apyrenoidigerum.ctg26510:757-1410(+)
MQTMVQQDFELVVDDFFAPEKSCSENFVEANVPLPKSRSANLIRNDSARSSPSQSFSGSQRTFRCPYEECQKDFNKKYNMQMHLRQHTGEKPYVCNYQSCGLRFKWRSSLRNHLRYHYPDQKIPEALTTTGSRRRSRSAPKQEKRADGPSRKEPELIDIPFQIVQEVPMFLDEVADLDAFLMSHDRLGVADPNGTKLIESFSAPCFEPLNTTDLTPF